MDRKILIFPVIFAAVLTPVFVVALLTYQPGSGASCEAVDLPALAHSHWAGLETATVDDVQLIFNVSAAAPLYEVVDGSLQLCAGDLTDSDLKHITVDVKDARLVLGERLPVDVSLVIRQAATGRTVLRASAPAMYSAGHGYHFGDNYLLAADAAYEWEVTVSPVQALRHRGAEALWLEPVVWTGRFQLDADGNVIGQPQGLVMLGEFTQSGVHVALSRQAAQPLYAIEDGAAVALPLAPDSHYFIVDVTDHTVNLEEKLLGALVSVAFQQGAEVLDVALPAAISPVYGFHYGANVALPPGEWTATLSVSGLDFLRHAGAAVSLPRGTISQTFQFTLPVGE